MARPLRIHPPGGFHHVTARGNDRQAIFLDDTDRASFLALVADVGDRFATELHAFCLMSNHVHLVVQDHSGELSKSLRHIKGVHAQRFNRRHGRVGHLFEGRFWNSLLGDDSYLATAVEYVHQNPVAAGIVGRPDDYQFSSFRAYAGRDRAPRGLNVGKVLGLYGSRRAFLEAASRSAGGSDRFDEFAAQQPAPVLGSESFVRLAMQQSAACSETRASAGSVWAAPARRELELIAEQVAGRFEVEKAELFASSAGRRNTHRMVVVEVARREGWPMAKVAEFFGFSSSNTASMACSRLAKQLAADAELESVVEELSAVSDES